MLDPISIYQHVSTILLVIYRISLAHPQDDIPEGFPPSASRSHRAKVKSSGRTEDMRRWYSWSCCPKWCARSKKTKQAQHPRINQIPQILDSLVWVEWVCHGFSVVYGIIWQCPSGWPPSYGQLWPGCEWLRTAIHGLSMYLAIYKGQWLYRTIIYCTW